MNKVKIAKTVSSGAVTYTVWWVEALCKTAKLLGKGVIGNSSKMKYVKKMKYFEDTKNVVGGAGSGIASVYLGMFGAITTIGSSLANTTGNVISHKYGDRAGEIVNHVTDVGGETFKRVDETL